MPRKCETKEQRIARNAYQMKSHHRKVDNIVKLGELFLGPKAKSMELKDVLAAVREELVRRNPGLHNRKNDAYLCRTLEYDDVRASVWVSSDMSENRTIFDKKIAELKQKKELAEAKVHAKMLKSEQNKKLMEMIEAKSVKPHPMRVPVETMDAEGAESEQMEHQSDELEEYLRGEPHEFEQLYGDHRMEAMVDEVFEEPQQMPAARAFQLGEFKEYGKLQEETDVDQTWQRAMDEMAFWEEQIQEHDRDFKRFKADQRRYLQR